MPVSMAVNGEKVQRRAGCNILGDPLDAMVSLANARSRAGDELRAGDMHNTGTATDIYWLGRADLEPSCKRLNHMQKLPYIQKLPSMLPSETLDVVGLHWTELKKPILVRSF